MGSRIFDKINDGLSSTECDTTVIDMDSIEETLANEEAILVNYNSAIKGSFNILMDLETHLCVESIVDLIEDDAHTLTIMKSLSNEDFVKTLNMVGVAIDPNLMLSAENKKTLIEQVLEAIKKLIDKIIATAKKYYAKLLVYSNGVEANAKALISRFNTLDKDYFENIDESILEELKANHGLYYTMSGDAWSTKLIRTMMDFDNSIISNSVKDIERIQLTDPTVEDYIDVIADMTYIPGNTIENVDIVNGLLTVRKELEVTNNTTPIYDVINTGILSKVNKDSLTIMTIVCDDQNDLGSVFNTRRMVECNVVVTEDLFKSKSMGVINSKRDIIKLLTNVTKLSSYIKDDYSNKLKDYENSKKIVKNIGKNFNEPDLAKGMNASLAIHASLLSTCSSVRIMSSIKLLNNLIKAMELHYKLFK